LTVEPNITDLLETYGCAHPLAVVRMRFWGAINSPVERISPTKEIDALWSGKRRPFKTEDEAQTFYDGMIALWNALAKQRETGTPVALSPRSGLNTVAGLKRAMTNRHDEIDGFYAGLIANVSMVEPFLPSIDANLEKLANVTGELESLINGPIGSGNISKVRSRFVTLDKRAQKLINLLAMQTRVSTLGGSAMH
jgi:hypothetical protein